jgi:hypothetical protein
MKPLVSALATLAFLSVPLAALDVQVPAAVQPAWDRLVAAHPVPPGIASGAIVVRDVAIRVRDDGTLEGPGVPPAFKIVETSVLAPVARFWEALSSVTRASAESGLLRLVPLENVALPDVALPVDGLSPGDPAYPLVRGLAVAIHGDDDRLVRWFESLPLPDPTEQPRIRWIGAVGDIMPARGVDAELLAPGGEQRVFGDTLPTLRELDLLIGNLEASATGAGTKARKTYTFRFDPRALKGLAGAGFSYLSLANNHTFDYGTEGFLETLVSLADAGIATSGAGWTVQDASLPAVLKVGDMEVRLLSFGAYPVDRTGFDGRATARAGDARPGTLWLDEDGLAAAARGFSPTAFNIAIVHGGEEWSTTPTAAQRKGYHDLVSAGADLVIGSHPHVLQGLEAVNGSLIAYSLGNFLFPGMDGTPGGESSAILEVGTWNRKIVALRIVPVRLRGTSVRLDPQPDTAAAVRSLSRPLNR